MGRPRTGGEVPQACLVPEANPRLERPGREGGLRTGNPGGRTDRVPRSRANPWRTSMSNDECRKSKARGIANRPAAKEEVAVRGRTTADEQLWICRDGAGVYLGEVEAPDLHHARSVAMG